MADGRRLVDAILAEIRFPADFLRHLRAPFYFGCWDNQTASRLSLALPSQIKKENEERRLINKCKKSFRCANYFSFSTPVGRWKISLFKFWNSCLSYFYTKIPLCQYGLNLSTVLSRSELCWIIMSFLIISRLLSCVFFRAVLTTT